MRLTMQNIHLFQSEIEYLLSGDETRRVVFTRVDGSVRQFNPVLRIQNASINLPDRSQVLLIDNLEVEFDFWQSLIQWAPVVLEIDGQLKKIKLDRDAEGRWWMYDLELSANPQQEYTDNFSQYLALVPRYLDLHLRRLIIEDKVTGHTHQLDAVDARIDFRNDQLRFELAASLSAELGGSLLLKSSVGEQRGQIYVQTSRLNVGSFVELFDLNSLGLQDGILQGEFWMNLNERSLTSVKGDFALHDGLLHIADDQSPLRFSYQSRFDAVYRSDSWLIANQVQQLRIEELEVPAFNTQALMSADDQPLRIWAWFDRVPIDGLPSLAAFWLPDDIRDPLLQSRLQGHIENGLLHINLARADDFRAKLRVVGLSSQRVADIPGIENLNAEIVAVKDHVSLQVSGENTRVDFGDEFVAPFELDRVSAEAVLQKV